MYTLNVCQSLDSRRRKYHCLPLWVSSFLKTSHNWIAPSCTNAARLIVLHTEHCSLFCVVRLSCGARMTRQHRIQRHEKCVHPFTDGISCKPFFSDPEFRKYEPCKSGAQRAHPLLLPSSRPTFAFGVFQMKCKHV